MLYFAYGSNMNRAQMQGRCPDARPAGHGFAKGYELVFGRFSQKWNGAAASIDKKRGAATLGRLWELTPHDLERLDRFEGYPTIYGRRSITVQTDKGNRKAIAYFIVPPFDYGQPSQSYLDIIKAAYRELGYRLEMT